MKQFSSPPHGPTSWLCCVSLVSFAYFATPISEGLVLGGHDTVAGMGQGQEQAAYHEATGERSRWTNSIFSGMPTYQIFADLRFDESDERGRDVVRLCTSGPLGFLFLYLFGFYLLIARPAFQTAALGFRRDGMGVSSISHHHRAGHSGSEHPQASIPPTNRRLW